MKIGLIARRLTGQPLGVARYIQYLLKYWAEQLDPAEEAVLLAPEPIALNGFPRERYQTRIVSRGLKGVPWENLVLPFGARDLDVLFGPSYTLPVAYPGRSVVAIHSMNEIESGTHPWWYRLTYSPIYRASAARAARVIVPSHSTLEDIQKLWRLPAEKLVVVPQGADDAFRPIQDAALLADARRKWVGDDRPFIVFVGKLSQRRNIGTLIRAFGQVKREHAIPHALLLMGPNHLNLPLAEIAREAGVSADVVQTDGQVSSHDELAAVYSAADLYVTASLYEGFSLTLAEALACGTPVVASNRGALGEIAGDAAVLVDNPVEEELAEAMWKVLADEQLQAELRRRGPERARLFRLEETARQTLAVLREVGSEKR
jgi:glycosyltransferase involved in cell wall biosynthesis